MTSTIEAGPFPLGRTVSLAGVEGAKCSPVADAEYRGQANVGRRASRLRFGLYTHLTAVVDLLPKALPPNASDPASSFGFLSPR